MKLRLNIKSSNDVLTWDVWVWFINIFRSKKKPCYRSSIYAIEVYSRADYWEQIGRKQILIDIIRSSRLHGIQGLSLLQLILKVAVLEYGQSTIVAVYGMDYMKLAKLAERLPLVTMRDLYSKEVLYIPCPSMSVAEKIKAGIPNTLANSAIIDKGMYMTDVSGV
jgi:hypothetical protein